MQDDGNLVYYSKYNTALWAGNTGISSVASSQCVLSGSTSIKDVTLSLYNYSAHTSKVLFGQSWWSG